MDHTNAIISSPELLEDLRIRALAGDIDSSKRLFEHYSAVGDRKMERKYASFMVMQGDMDMCWEMVRREWEVIYGSPEDDRFSRSPRRYGTLTPRYRCVNSFNFGCEVFGGRFIGMIMNLAEAGDPDAVVYRALMRSASMQGFAEDPDVRDTPRGKLLRAYPLIGNADHPGAIYTDLDPVSEPEAREGLRLIRESAEVRPAAASLLAELEALGLIAELDWDSALVHALEGAEGGQFNSACLVAFLTGAGFPSDSYLDGGVNDHEGSDLPRHMMPQVFADAGAREWAMLAKVTGTDWLGFTTNPEYANSDGGYENDVFSLHPSEEGPGSMVFEPTGLEMAWDECPWDCGCMSEPLTVGEIRHVWRLCLDSVLFGDTFDPADPGTGTSEWLRSHPFRTADVPEELRGRVDDVVSRISDRPGDWNGYDDRLWTYQWNLGANLSGRFFTWDEVL